jgi:hypothetical protein
MITATRPAKSSFYQRYLMARQQIDPAAHGVDMGKEEFTDLVVGELADYGHGAMSIDELLLRPRAALQFCDTVRMKHGWFDLPDDMILRAIMQRRKNPGYPSGPQQQ